MIFDSRIGHDSIDPFQFRNVYWQSHNEYLDESRILYKVEIGFKMNNYVNTILVRCCDYPPAVQATPLGYIDYLTQSKCQIFITLTFLLEKSYLSCF